MKIGNKLKLISIACTTLLASCVSKGPNPVDPYEKFNRKIFQFNQFIDTALIKPPTIMYTTLIPSPIRTGIANAYSNINMLPTTANDILQADGNQAIKDTWRFIVNSTFGIGGLIDVATTFKLPPHRNDLGLTWAHWGDKNSPYLLLPLLGPSTIRDAMALLFDYTYFTPYFYIHSDPLLFGIAGLGYINVRSQILDSEKLLDEAIDKYAMMRDAYLQHRQYLLTGERPDEGQLYVD